jgi:ADP-heptose:LPS heptosyltransferase
MLVLRALGLGDLLTAVPALRALAAAYPRHRRVLAAPSSLAPLVPMTAAVHDLVPAEPLAPLPAELAGKVDVAVNLHGRGPQSHRILLALCPRRLVAFACPGVPGSEEGPRWEEGEHEVARWCRLLTESGIPADPSLLSVDPPALAPELAHASGATVVHPGAAYPARRWPPERWASVAAALAHSGQPVVVTGGPAETGLARHVAEHAGLPDASVLAGRTDLGQLAAVVAAAARVACADTGVAHLATAVDTPSVVLFGPTSPAEWGPPADDEAHRVLWAGSVGDAHADHTDPGLLSITVDDVLHALATLPPRVRPRAAQAATQRQ